MKTISEKLITTPKGTKLYSRIDGEVELEEVDKDKIILSGRTYDPQGKLNPSGECLIFPSRTIKGWDSWGAYFVSPSENIDELKAKLRLLREKGGTGWEEKYLERAFINSYFQIDDDGKITILRMPYHSEYIKCLISTGTELILKEKIKKSNVEIGDVVKIDGKFYEVTGIIIYPEFQISLEVAKDKRSKGELSFSTRKERQDWSRDVLHSHNLKWNEAEESIVFSL